MTTEHGYDINNTIVKLENLKTLVENDSEKLKFDDLIDEARSAKSYQVATDNLEDDDEFYEDFDYEGLPEDYWAQEYEVEDQD